MIPLKAMLTPEGQLEKLEAISFCPIPHSNAAKITDPTDKVVLRKELEPLEAPRPTRGRGRGRARWQGPEDNGPVARESIEKLRYLGGESDGFGDRPSFSSAWTKVEKIAPVPAPEEVEPSLDDSFANWQPDSAASMAAGNGGGRPDVPAVPPPIFDKPKTKKGKASGYVMFLQSLRRKNGDEDGSVDALIRKYDSEWQRLPEARKAYWRDKGRGVRNAAESASASTSAFAHWQAPYQGGGGRNDFDSSAASVTSTIADDDDF